MDLTAPRPWWPLGDMDQMRDALQYWIANNWDTDITVGEWWERLASAGLAVPTWNRSHGGLAATAQVQQLVEDELALAGTIAPPLAGAGVRLIGPAVRQFATSEQAAEILPGMLTGQNLWTVLLLEPGIDDPIDTQCRCEFDWKYLTVTGTKLCHDHSATHAMTLTRSSDPGAGPRGRRSGLTWLLVELGYQPFDAATAALEFTSTRMLHDRVFGTRDDGWAVLQAITPYLQRSIAGRIRRGLVHVHPGSAAGNLDRRIAEVLDAHEPPAGPDVDRRGG